MIFYLKEYVTPIVQEILLLFILFCSFKNSVMILVVDSFVCLSFFFLNLCMQHIVCPDIKMNLKSINE